MKSGLEIIFSSICTRDFNKPGALEGLMGLLLGLKRLGHEVYLVEEVTAEQCYDSNWNPVSYDRWDGRSIFETITKEFSIWPKCCQIFEDGKSAHGMSCADLARVAKRADLVIVCGGRLACTPILENVRCLAYIDCNPAKTQVYASEYGVDYGFQRYDHFFTTGLNIGTPECELPTCDVTWNSILPAVYLDNWSPAINTTCTRFTTLSSWAGRKTFDYMGRHSGEKSDSWLKVIELPMKTSQELEIALAIDHSKYKTDLDQFLDNGWIISDPSRFRTVDELRSFYANSRAEFSIAHGRYVEFNSGWFSERSSRYLALGKPVLVQSTGIEGHLPTGKGLLTFRTIEEAVAAIEEINRDYLGHCRAAREIAEEYFDSDKVLTQMLQQMGF